jgi:O-antigen/teichoic acid export membrane protein
MVGHGFANALLAIRWLCWLPALRGVHQLAGGALTATGRQNYRTVAQFLVAALNVALNLVWIPAHGWIGAAWASLISDGTLGLLNLSLVLLIFSRAGDRPRHDTLKEQSQ